MSYKRTKRKKLVSGVALAAFTYTSVLFTVGMVAGYVVTKWFYKKYVLKGPLSPIYLNVYGLKIHFHHWIMAALVILIFLTSGLKSELPKFLWGFLVGIAVEDIYDFDDWHKVLVKKKATPV